MLSLLLASYVTPDSAPQHDVGGKGSAAGKGEEIIFGVLSPFQQVFLVPLIPWFMYKLSLPS